VIYEITLKRSCVVNTTMNIVLNPSEVNIKTIHYHHPVTNTVMDDSSFVRVGYSDENICLNAIFIDTAINVNRIDKYFHKYKYNFDYSSNMDTIDSLIAIERLVLESIHLPGINRTFKLREQLLNSNIRVFENSDSNITNISPGNYKFTLKISGIWVTDIECGLTFKFFLQN